MEKSIWMIPIIHVFAFTVNILLGKFLKKKAALVSIVSSFISILLALPVFAKVLAGDKVYQSWHWLDAGFLNISFGYYIDPLGVSLLFVVLFIGTLIQIYSTGYMADEKKYTRFFAYLSLFMSGMLMFIIANNYLQFFMSWEIMGLCSYLLIGFYFEKPEAAKASLKAFLTTRVGDIGLFLGILTVALTLGTLQFKELHEILSHSIPHNSVIILSVGALLIFCGTIGKSAQLPLHVWLPDAMQGPTPVSALIHAATMVAAGIFLVIRSFDLFYHFPNILEILTLVGTFTAFGAACIALTANDIKKVLAYSTISQLGYMVAALGLGAPAAAMFHLITHAFFKACLFLGAGSIIHGTGTQDIRELGGLFKKMPHTAWTFLISGIAIAGVPPLAGFWSKDEILLAAFPHSLAFTFLMISAFMTAFYMFRLIFLTLFGKARNEKVHPHESPWTMTLPLWLLAIGAIFIGIPGSLWTHHWFQHFLHLHYGPHPEPNYTIMALSVIAGLSGIAMAYVLYHKPSSLPEKLAKRFESLYTLSVNKFYIDEVYSNFLIRPFMHLGKIFSGWDKYVMDALVNAAGTVTLFISGVKAWIDKVIVDGAIHKVAEGVHFLNSLIKRIQGGLIQGYLLIAMSLVAIYLFYEMGLFKGLL